jgi:hypothetical protein
MLAVETAAAQEAAEARAEAVANAAAAAELPQTVRAPDETNATGREAKSAPQFTQEEVDNLIAAAVAAARADALALAELEKRAHAASVAEALATVKEEAQAAVESSQTRALALLEGEIANWQAASAKELNDKNQQLQVLQKKKKQSDL